MITAPVFCHRLIGRQRELEDLRTRYRAAAGGQGSLVLLAGEAGIGKSRFLAEARSVLIQLGAAWASSQCLEHTQSPLGPLIDVLRESHDRAPDILTSSARLCFGLGHLLPELLGPAREEARAVGDRHGQFAAVAEALRRLACAQPLIVAIDDMQWADPATLDCVQYAAERIADAPLLVILAYRSDELHRRHPLTGFLVKLQRLSLTWTIQLRSLSDAEMRSFVSAALEGRQVLGSEPLHEILALAEGNPLFLEELLKHALERSSDGLGIGEFPLSIKAAVLDRLTAFNEDRRTTLLQASAIGRRFEPRLLARVTDRPLDAVVASLHHARDAQLIVEERGEPTRYCFRHALIREALYSELLAAEARPLHARVAAELEDLPPSDERDLELAYHWWSARDAAKAAEYNERAGDLAARRLAHEEAATFYERALEFLAGRDEAEARLCEKIGEVLRLANVPERARRALERALAYYRRTANWEKTAEVLSWIGFHRWMALEMEEALESYLSALAVTNEHPEHELHLRALAQIAHFYALRGDVEGASRYGQRAAAFRGRRSPREGGRLHNAWALIAALRGDEVTSVAHHRRSIALSTFIDDPWAKAIPHQNSGYVAMDFASYEFATEEFERGISIAHEHFIPALEAYGLAGLATMHLLAGNLERARSCVEGSVALVVEPVWGLQLQLAATAIPTGLRLEDEALVAHFAREELIESAFKSQESQRILPICAAFAELYAQRGKEAEAAALLHRALVAVSGVSAGGPWSTVAVAPHADPADINRAREMLARWARPEANLAGKALLALFDTIAARRRGDDVRVLAQGAEAALRRVRLPYYLALTLEILGRRDEARELYRKMGDLRGLHHLEAAGIQSRARRAKDELTPREREIAVLVAAGKSNRAIADQLVISERTVENHLASIFNKLQIGSRTELTARIAREESAR